MNFQVMITDLAGDEYFLNRTYVRSQSPNEVAREFFSMPYIEVDPGKFLSRGFIGKIQVKQIED